MFKWLKFTFGSFFSNKLSKEAKTRSLWNFLFAITFSFIILLSFIVLSINLSFTTHYNNATSFKELNNSLFYSTKEADALNIKVIEEGDNTKIAAYFGEDSTNLALINTFENEDDKALYSKNNYNVIVDTRDSDTSFVEFELNYVNTNDSTLTVTPDGYRELSSADKQNYQADLKLTTNLVVIDDTLTTSNKTWLNDYFNKLSDEEKENSSLYKEYEQIKDNGSKEAIYSLYTRAYYSLNNAPTIVSYYQNTYAVLDENNNFKYQNYMVITDVWALVSFTTDSGINITYDGFYNGLDSNFVIHTAQTYNQETIKDNVDRLIKNIYTSASGIKTIYNAISVFRFMPYILLSLVVIPLFAFGICKIRKHSYADRFIDSFKISSSHLILSCIISSLVGLIAAFFVDTSTLFIICCWGALLVLVLRQFIFVILEEIHIKKHPEEEVITVTPTTTTNTTSTTNKEKVVLDNKPIDMKAKIIKNENVDDDEEETMDFM